MAAGRGEPQPDQADGPAEPEGDADRAGRPAGR